MNLIVTLEMRFDRTSDGAVWTQAAFAYSFWQRYLEVFDSVCVVARVQNVEVAQSDWLRADGERVVFSSLPYYIGPRQYLLNFRQMRQSIRGIFQEGNAVIFRVPSPIAATAASILKQRDWPYGVEVVGDPYDVFAPGAVRHPLRPFFRWWFPRQLRRLCAGASTAAYVTQQTLQNRYPPQSQSVYSTYYSDVELSAKAFVNASRQLDNQLKSFTLATIGSLEQLYKGTDVLISALKECVNSGLDVKLIIIGDGKHRHELEVMSASLGMEKSIQFLGQIPSGDDVRTLLDASDVFMLPSRTEGLPRAMIEAMARGLPCIGSTVGGIPELLPAEDMVPPNDAHALAEKIREVVTNPERMAAMSARNLDKAREYADNVLYERRTAFYQHLKAETEAWLKTRRDRYA